MSGDFLVQAHGSHGAVNVGAIVYLKLPFRHGIGETIKTQRILKPEFWGILSFICTHAKANMSTTRIFTSSEFFQLTAGEPVRSVITESKDAVVVAWYIQPGQEIPAHIHPHGQDTWTILSGMGDYYLDPAGTRQPIMAGDVVIAPTGCVHGVFNPGVEPLVFISIVSPSDAGYHRLSLE